MFGRKRPRKQRVSIAKLVILKQFLIGIFSLSLLGGVIWGTWYISRLPALTISKIEVRGGETVDHEEIRKLVEKELEGEYYRLLPKRFVWVYPDNKIAEQVSSLPRVKEVVVSRTGGNNLLVVFSEYRPYALWCSIEENDTSSECLFIDESGYAFAPAPLLSGSSFIRYTDRRRSPALGMVSFEQTFLQAAEDLVANMSKSFSFRVKHAERLSDKELEIYLVNGGSIKVALDQSTDETLDALSAVLSANEFAHLRNGEFKYIDLRYGNKVFVNDQQEDELTEDLD